MEKEQESAEEIDYHSATALLEAVSAYLKTPEDLGTVSEILLGMEVEEENGWIRSHGVSLERGPSYHIPPKTERPCRIPAEPAPRAIDRPPRLW